MSIWVECRPEPFQIRDKPLDVIVMMVDLGHRCWCVSGDPSTAVGLDRFPTEIPAELLFNLCSMGEKCGVEYFYIFRLLRIEVQLTSKPTRSARKIYAINIQPFTLRGHSHPVG